MSTPETDGASGCLARGHPDLGADDRGSLPLAMLLTLVGVMLSGLLVPVVLTQVGATRQVTTRTRAAAAAFAGLQVALAHLRATTTGVTGLPCGPLTGAVSAGGPASYRVTIDYLATDPFGHPDTWIPANRIACTAGAGTASTPRYASLVAVGADQPTVMWTAKTPTRQVRATYALRVAQTPSTGGAIRVYGGSTSTSLCLDAAAAVPAAGTVLRTQPCVDGSQQQAFAYQSNLTLVLVSSMTATAPLGMCVDAGAPHTPNRVVRVQPCLATTTPQQQWTFNDWGNFEGTANGTSLDGFCLNARNPGVAGSFVVLGSVARSTCHQAYDNAETFVPDAGVGSGAAGPDANQLLNFGQYSRCLEVTNGDTATAYLIAAPCQQSPDPVNVGWRQRWATPIIAPGTVGATGVIATDPTVGRVCLRSPGVGGPGRYVTLTACPAGAPPQNLAWTVAADTGTYATSYQVTDGFGNCLAPTDPAATPPDLHQVSGSISKIIVTTCNGSSAQKWNAMSNLQTSKSLMNIEER